MADRKPWVLHGEETILDLLELIRRLRAENEALRRDREKPWEWRDVEDPCSACGGRGIRTYGSTATWQGGIGGQMMTNAVCDVCWGSGDAQRKWTDLRKVGAEVEALRKDKARLDWLGREMEREAAGSQAWSLFRRNIPITREAIDAAMAQEQEGGE